jgi:hypothetical protein
MGSCHDRPVTQAEPVVISAEKLDTIKNNEYRVVAEPSVFETAFFNGTQARADQYDIVFFPVTIGELKVESGKIIACDPIVMHSWTPFIQRFPKGHFPVQLAIARIQDDERVAFSRIFFSNKPVTGWRYALQNGQKDISIFDSTFYGYGVDGGVAIFIDSVANKSFNEMAASDKTVWEKVFDTEMNKHTRKTWEHLVYNFGDHNLAAFSTGLGDGSYATYIGLDKDGNICRLLTDFGFVNWWKK